MFFDLDKAVDKDLDALRLFDLTRPADIPLPQDEFEVEYTDENVEWLTDDELISNVGKIMFFDGEFYPNVAFVTFRLLENNKIISFCIDDDLRLGCNFKQLRWLLSNFCLVGFNSKNYDLPLTRMFATGKYNAFQLKEMSNWIVNRNSPEYLTNREFGLSEIEQFNHIDLIEVAPLDGSLKKYAARLHCKRIQDLPYEHTAILTDEQKSHVFKYNINDLTNTGIIYNELLPALNLRQEMSKEYGIDLRSKSDAQIAEHVIVSEIKAITGNKPKRPDIPAGSMFYYHAPRYLRFKTPAMQKALEVVESCTFVIGENGAPILPAQLKNYDIPFSNCIFRMGIGGLHSSETCVSHISDVDTLLIDRDVASYYPSIILNNGYAPKHLGETFLYVYKTIVERRLNAKAKAEEFELAGDIVNYKYCKGIADSLKITINGSFGKFGNFWSALYAPDLLLQVTLTGQLSLLLKIEMIETSGLRVKVISANTDGIIIKCHKDDKIALDNVIKEWETITSFKTEETQYKAVYSRDVNSYIAIKAKDGKTKAKGAYSEFGSAGNSSLSRNPESFVCLDAVAAFITAGTDIETTIRNTTDIRRFVHVRDVRGGARKSGKYLGKVARWYYSTNCKGIIETPKGHAVAKSLGGMPLMQLPETLPPDLDYQRYIDMTKEMLKDIAA